jgi:hypothetical protein
MGGKTEELRLHILRGSNMGGGELHSCGPHPVVPRATRQEAIVRVGVSQEINVFAKF